MPILRGRVRDTHFGGAVASKGEFPVGCAVRQRVARIVRVSWVAECPDGLDVVPALAAHADLVEGVNVVAFDLVVEACPVFAVVVFARAGCVRDDDSVSLASGCRDFPRTVLPLVRVFVVNQHVHCARIDGLHAPPPVSFTSRIGDLSVGR